jgi:osmotically-inducible protein OsmY
MVNVTGRQDLQIQRDILDEFDWNPEIQPTEVGVEVEGGIVTLSGTVTSSAKKLAAERSAQRIAGVRAVANDLIVRPDGSNVRNDTDIARAVASALEWSAIVPDERIQVSVADGIVNLQGGVDFNFQRTEAERQVMALSGVKGLHNDITITPPVTSSPDEIQGSILRALQRHAVLDEDALSVEVRGHVVVLSGAVPSEADRAEAERLAWGPGVFKVDNRIKVAPPAPQSPVN